VVALLKAVLPFAIGSALLVPTYASANIYKWVDEHGTTVFSNTLPAKKPKGTKVEIVIEEDEAAKQAQAPQQLYQDEVLRRQQEMAARIAYLESQLRAQQQYQTPAPPPPSSDYSDSQPYYPSYYPYAYPYAVSPVRVVRPFRAARSSSFAAGRSLAFHGGHATGRR
jgi:hypothetical protein